MFCGKITTCKQENRLDFVPSVVNTNQSMRLTKINVLSLVLDLSAKFAPAVDQVEYSNKYGTGLNTTANGIRTLLATSQFKKLPAYLTFVFSVTSQFKKAHAFTGLTIKTITLSQMWYTLTRVATLNMAVILQRQTLVRALDQRTLDSIDNQKGIC